MTSKQTPTSGNSRPTTPSGTPSGSTRVKESPFTRLEQASKKLFRSSIRSKDRTVPNGLAAIQFGSIGILVPQDSHDSVNSASTGSRANDPPPLPLVASYTPEVFNSGNNNNLLLTLGPITSQPPSALAISGPVTSQPPSALAVSEPKEALSISTPAALQPWPRIFLQNAAVPSPKAVLPPPGGRLETTAQLAYCSSLVRAHLSPLTFTRVTASRDPAQQASIDAILQDKEEQGHILELTNKVIEEFAADSLKTLEEISEVILLGPSLDQEYHRKLLNCFITEFETAQLLDVDLLQGLVQLVECAGPDYLLPDDLVRILAVLRTRLQDTHQQSTKHPYYISLALSRLLDVMVEGKVQDLQRVVDHEPLSAILGQLANNSDPYLKHQAAHALQGLLHIPNDETRRQFMLRHAGNIAMGLFGVASVCKLDFSAFSEGVGKLYSAAESAVEVGVKVVGGVQSIRESGQAIIASVIGGVLSGGRLIWYSALREAQEHVRDGRLADFNRLVFEAPCCQDVDFQWGICQLLGDIAVDPQWEITTRQHAVTLLAELYKNDDIWSFNGDIAKWMLRILQHVVALPDPDISNHAQLVLHSLEEEDDAVKQALYRNVMDASPSPYPIKIRLSVPLSSPLLIRVLAIPDVEYCLHRLRTQRLKESKNVLYIPPQAKPTLQSDDTTLFPLMEKALEFLANSGQVLLLLGNSGGGKSTFNLQLEHTLWKEYKRGGPIPLHINLPGIDNPLQNMIAKHLHQLNFSDVQIQELKQHRQFIVICDGYDESQLKKNLYTTNQWNQPGQWEVKAVISCRTQYLGSDYRSLFQPTVDRYAQPTPDISKETVIAPFSKTQPTPDIFKETVIAPFSKTQIEQYVEQYVLRVLPHVANPAQPAWNVKDYMEKLVKIPNLIDLVSNPFLLTLALRALPSVVRYEENLSVIQLTRVGLYDSFIEEWLKNNKCRLEDSVLSLEAQSTFDILREEGFVQLGIRFQKDLAEAIFQYQHGNPVVEYAHLRERHTWKASFFSPDTQTAILREASPLARSGKQYRFLHRSLLEYLYSRVMSDPVDPESDTNDSRASFLNHPLNQRSIVSEPSVLQFLAERVELDPSFKSRLFAAIEDSKSDAQVSQAAANAISILIRADVRFNGADLRGIKIPGADLRGGQFDSADLEGADLSNVNLGRTWLRQANLSKTQMTGVEFGELPYLQLDDLVSRAAFSFEGDLLAVLSTNFRITIFSTASWTKIASHAGGRAIAISSTTRELAMSGQDNTVKLGDIITGKIRVVLAAHENEVYCIAYSPDGSLIATGSKDTTVRIWSTFSGDILHTLSGHTESVYGVAFSHTGAQLVSCSGDKSLRAWNTQTGELMTVFEGHHFPVYCMAYSPDGRQIASGDRDGNIRLWDAITCENTHVLSGHSEFVNGVAYSPDGHQFSSCGIDGSIRIWDSQTGELFATLSGHLESVKCAEYSPTGDFLASGGADGTVRRWRIGGGVLSHEVSSGDVHRWECVVLSPCGDRVVMGGSDGTLQFWETLTGKPITSMTENMYLVHRAAFSPCGQRIATACSDHSVRLLCAHTLAILHVFRGHTGRINTAFFSPDGHYIVSASQDMTIRIWDCETGESGFTLKGQTGMVIGALYSPSGRQIASTSTDKKVRLWCAQTGEQLFVLSHTARVSQVMYSTDDQQLTTVERSNGTLRFWNCLTGESTDRQGMANVYVFCCSYLPDRELLATGNKDGTLRLWDSSSSTFVEVFRSVIGLTLQMQWRQGAECSYLTTRNYNAVRVWKLIENNNNTFELQLLWSLGKKELSLGEANMTGAIGLSPVDVELVKQRGAITELKGEDEDGAEDRVVDALVHEE